MRGIFDRSVSVLMLLALAPAGPAGAEEVVHGDGVRHEFGTQIAVNLVAERDLYWSLSDTFAADSGFDPDATWLEWYVKPHALLALPLGDWEAFAKASVVASGTQGTDAYAARSQSEASLEEAHLGLRRDGGQGWDVEASVGPRELKLGTGMLFSNGGSNGFERGALKLGPRKAWDLAAIVRLSRDGHGITLFRLSPNELDSGDNENRVLGADWRHDGRDDSYLGATLARLTRSASPYPRAGPPGSPPTVLPGGREGLEVLDAYGRTPRLALGDARLALTGELALERNNRIDLGAWGGRIQVELGFPQARWQPLLVASTQVFGGDDPGTARLERFDPLFYEGSPASWATGSKSAMVFINSNLRSHHLSLRLTPTPRDMLTFRYAHVRADELLSPLQFGQGTRTDFADGSSAVLAGVTDPHLSDDLFIEYLRIASPRLYLGAGLSVSVPGRGIRSVVPGNTPNWIGAYANVVFSY